MEDKLKSLINRDEIRRLEKAARDKNKMKLVDWAKQFEESMRQEYQEEFKKELDLSIDNFILTIIYTLHFNQKTQFGNKRIKDFMEDLFATIDMFRTEEYKPEEYRKILENEGIYIKKKEE